MFNPHGKTKAAKRKLPLNEIATEVLSKRIEQSRGAYLFPALKLVPLTEDEKNERSSRARTKRKLETKHKRRLDYEFKKVPDHSKHVLKLNNAHSTALRNGGLPHFRMYDFRHTWATRAAESGIDLLTIAALLGHSRIEMVKRYAHPTDEHKFRAVKRLEAYNQSLMNVKEQCTNMGTLIN